MKEKKEKYYFPETKGAGLQFATPPRKIHIINVRRKIAIFAILIQMNPLNPHTNPGYPSHKRKFSLS